MERGQESCAGQRIIKRYALSMHMYDIISFVALSSLRVGLSFGVCDHACLGTRWRSLALAKVERQECTITPWHVDSSLIVMLPWAYIPQLHAARLSFLNLYSRARLTRAQATAQQSCTSKLTDNCMASTQVRLRAPFSPMVLPAKLALLAASGLGPGGLAEC